MALSHLGGSRDAVNARRNSMGDIVGLPVVKFTLHFDGRLPPSAGSSKRVKEKWDIRKHLHPQLFELWQQHPGLITAQRFSVFPTTEGGTLDLCAPIIRGRRLFRPLVRSSYYLVCGLKILFLRKEPAGRVYQGGDLDSRIKTLLDSMSIPTEQQIIPDDSLPVNQPIYCLLEDDQLVTGLSVETDRLLDASIEEENFVKLIIEVDVRVAHSMMVNLPFLGN